METNVTNTTTETTETWYSIQVCIDDDWVADGTSTFDSASAAASYLEREELWGRATPWAHRIIKHTHTTEVTK